MEIRKFTHFTICFLLIVKGIIHNFKYFINLCHTQQNICAYSSPDSAVKSVKRKDVGALLLTYPAAGLSHCLDQDKQLEIAHAEIY